MKKRSHLPICMLLLFLCLTSGAQAVAGEIVPWLTGYVAINPGFPGPDAYMVIYPGEVYGKWGIENLPWRVYSPTCQPTVLQSCSGSWSGDLTGASADADLFYRNGVRYSLRASFTSGTYQGNGTVSCASPDCSTVFMYATEVDSGSFTGTWVGPSGVFAKAVGDLSVRYGLDCEPTCHWDLGGGGSIVTTTTPEPNTFFMFGAGLGGLAGVLRRKLML